MLILLPPSEGKASEGKASEGKASEGKASEGGALAGDTSNVDGSSGRAVASRRASLDLASLSFPELTAARTRVLGALISLCGDPDPSVAATALGLGPTQIGEVARNAALRSAPAMPAARVYTGVLYEALDVATLSRDARAFVDRAVVIFSGLWGAVRLDDRIPAYRCSIFANLPGLGGLAAAWRAEMAPALTAAAGDKLVMDLRSGAYAAMWAPPGDAVTVRVLHERTVDGTTTRSVVSHFNKATKGRLVRDLATGAAALSTSDELLTALRDLKYTVEERLPLAARRRRFDIVVAEL
jgi:cytoplasmic iron level regulating protein YaaA (DUF328/UPF0246 family)